VRVSDASALADARRVVPPGCVIDDDPVVDGLYSWIVGGDGPRRGMRRSHILYEGSERVARSLDHAELLDAFENDLHFKVALHARTRLFVHAGVVGWRGKAIVIPGRTFAGKSSLVAALVEAGAEYYSDEYAVLDDQGQVFPFARPLKLRDSSGRGRPVDVAELGGRAGVGGIPVGMIVSTRYVPEGRWRPRRLSAGLGVLALFDNTVAAQKRPGDALRILGAAAQQSLYLRGPRGEARQTAEWILARASVEERGVAGGGRTTRSRKAG
jgi:hypothetical protein